MRVLHLFASPVWSGPADLIAALAAAQRKLGHEVTVAVDRKRTHPSAEEPIVPRLQALGLLDEGGLELSVKSSPVAVLQDLARLRSRQVDVIHAHFSHDHLLARLGGPPSALLVRSVHAPRSLRWSLPRAAAFTVPSASLLERLGTRRGQVLPAPVPDAFSPPEDRAALRSKLGLEGEPLVGMVSTFQPSRRHALGIAAFARLLADRPRAQLVLLGNGALEPQLRARVESAHLGERVHFAGYRSGGDFIFWLQALDEVWILGLGNDWSGRAAAQARACGVRVVAVEEGALGDYADVPLSLSDLSPEAVVRASLCGVRRELPVHSPEELAEGLDALYESCRAGRSR